MIIPERVARRVQARTVPGPGGCALSTYSTGSHGYAQIGWHEEVTGRRMCTTAHRAAWVAANARQIPDGMTVDHICKVKRCVNPEHLRLLSNFQNGRRTSGRDWPLGECAQGHPDSELITEPSGRRRCGMCLAEKRDRERKTA